MNALTIKSNGLMAREKGQSLANDALDAFSNTDCPETRRAWFEEAMFDLAELSRLDSAIPGFVEEMAPVLAAGHSVEANIGAAERDKALVELYAHPDGEQVFFCKKSNRLMAWVTGDNPAYVEIPIGPHGLRQLATDLLNVANELEAA
ncbi:hypothetical protein [Malikia sp.]|uniref:hypothetical protein n=1 Tax=Malikia sp. TaxID=2070706 RepID=UPI0026219FB8|nr:hypothetical protein [Malikia sp.]MDD2729177.1 hypothetical protein [Malikia sp.]